MPAPDDAALRARGYVPGALLRHGAVYKARVLEARRGDRRVIVKDLSPMSGWFRRVWGRRMLEREATALAVLADCAHAPRIVERIERDALALEFVPGSPLRKRLPRGIAPDVLASLDRAVRAVHEHGLAHLDLRQRRNILVRADGHVTLIDFESSWNVRSSVIGRLLRPVLWNIDRQAVLKWKARILPAALSDDERASLRRFNVWKRFWVFKKASKHLRRWVGIGRKARIGAAQDSSPEPKAPTNGAGSP